MKVFERGYLVAIQTVTAVAGTVTATSVAATTVAEKVTAAGKAVTNGSSKTEDPIGFLIFAILVQTGVLVWGLRLLSEVFRTQTASGRSVGVEMLTEKSINIGPSRSDASLESPGSFSRLAGAIGAIALAASFSGTSFWALHTLFVGGNFEAISDLTTFYAVGAALFIPYAFNQLRGLFS